MSCLQIYQTLLASFSDAAISSPQYNISDSSVGTSSFGDPNEVPSTLFNSAEMEEKLKLSRPSFVNTSNLLGKAIPNMNHTSVSALGLEQLQLSNGMRINICSRGAEPCVASLRVILPGGQVSEPQEHPGAHWLGCKALLEGGGLGNHSKEAVEMFCVDHMLAVDVQSIDDALEIDVGTTHSRDNEVGPSDLPSAAHKAHGHSESTEQISGLEAAFQVVHALLSPGLLRWDHVDFDIAKSMLKGDIAHASKDLDTLCRDAIIAQLSRNDSRFLMPSAKQLDALTLSMVKNAIQCQLVPSDAEVTVCGDAPVETMKELVLKYLGTLPSANRTGLSNETSPLRGRRVHSPWVQVRPYSRLDVNQDNLITKASSPSTSDIASESTSPNHNTLISIGERGIGAKIRIELPDPEPRAIGFVAGEE
jgi:hypothetical protein